MASVRVNPSTSKLFLDFRYQGKRYREFTQLTNTKRNVARLEKLGEKIEMEIQSGTFCYYEHFPESASGKRFAAEALQQQTSQLGYGGSHDRTTTNRPADKPSSGNTNLYGFRRRVVPGKQGWMA